MKRYLILFLMLSTIISCTEEKPILKEAESVMNSDRLKNIHQGIKQKFDDLSINKKYSFGYRDEIEVGPEEEIYVKEQIMKEYVDDVYDVNYKYVLENDVEKLFLQYGLNPELISMAEWAIENINDVDLYSKLYSRFSIENRQDADVLFYYVEVYKYLVLNNQLVSSKLLQARGSGCGRAVVGTLVVTAIFAGVTIATGGASLPAAIGFFAAKGWSTYNIIAACSEVRVHETIEVPFLQKEKLEIKFPDDINIPLLLIP
ncbi:hypothetical protein MK851_02390 [Tenacibaculum sp. 1B UA]|uniref:hypothetical protein n=1 Tax=Tenacibaculum sp. 1B UA TaxID=2922252 RepID=UPI002A23FC5C|nr:hypothetical protein [Tenacibaculum sp. 1B UA]MDX8552472.1 hypothetical protein [Tenacibaculum sp. 1B UA]